MGITKRLEAWVEAQLREHRDRTVDQGQEPQQGRQPPRLPRIVLCPEAQQGPFRRAMYQALYPQRHQQQGFQQYQPQGQQQYYDRNYQQQQAYQQQAHQQQVYQQQAHQQQAHQQQAQQQQAHQQQAHQQQAQLSRPPQYQPQSQREPSRTQSQSKHDPEKGPKDFRTTKADYFIIKRVGNSSEGTVSLARSTVAGRCIVKSVLSDGNTPREAAMLGAAGPHPNIVKMFEAVFDKSWGLAHMCMEYCSGGDLHELKCSYGDQHLPVPNQILLQAIVNVSDGLAFLHGGWVRDEKTGVYQTTPNARRIIHRDLKTTNIFVKPNGVGEPPTFVLGDFGQAFRPGEADDRFYGGTLGFRAPEFEKNPEIPITDKADVYSFGMTFVSVCQNLLHKPDKFVCGSHPDELRLPTYPQFYKLEKFLRMCLAIDPKDRPDMSPSGVLSVAKAYRNELERMTNHIKSPPKPRATDFGAARFGATRFGTTRSA